MSDAYDLYQISGDISVVPKLQKAHTELESGKVLTAEVKLSVVFAGSVCHPSPRYDFKLNRV
jgi:hypothetical protein